MGLEGDTSSRLGTLRGVNRDEGRYPFDTLATSLKARAEGPPSLSFKWPFLSFHKKPPLAFFLFQEVLVFPSTSPSATPAEPK